MADCGATGSAIDRAAAAVAGGEAASKAIGSFLGHVSMSSHGDASMPLAPPTDVELPLHHYGQKEDVSNIDRAWKSHGASAPAHLALQNHPASVISLGHHHQQQPMMMLPPPPHMQQLQMQQMHMQQLQMQQMILQQQQLRKHQQLKEEEELQKHQQKQGSVEEHDKSKALPKTEDEFAQRWHEGLDLEEELEKFRQENELDDDGGYGGATIEELAKAWADAEASLEEDAANLASAYYNPNSDADQMHSGQDETLLHPYEFGESSQTHPTVDRDWMAEGMEHFENGRTQEAVQSFETLLRHVDENHADAWRMLGRCHAENDEDRKAIACLERAVDRDPFSSEALLALGVSYVNELDHARALKNLTAWITHNPRFAGMQVPETDAYGPGDETNQLDAVQRLLLQALEFNPSEAGSIQEALGVVYNVSRDYDAAVSSFRAALAERPNDYQLWNKLGATLANNHKSDEALPVYHRALQLKPRYARAWLNMAISHSNLHHYDEAARCYLQTLSLNPDAGHCWSYLRIALSCSERWDLLPLAAAQNLDAFKDHFDFVVY